MNKTKMRKYAKILAAILCITVSFVLIFLGKCQELSSNDYFRNLTLQADEPLTEQMLQTVMAEHACENKESQDSAPDESIKAAAWTECKGESISDQISSRQCSADVICIYGSSRCLLPFGKHLPPSDSDGCIIGSKLAKELFGSISAEGKGILWRGDTWTIHGVVETPSRLLMVQTYGKEKEKPISLNRISLLLNAGQDRQAAADHFTLQNGLSARPLRWDYLYRLSWLKEMIPGKWSDFEQWKINLKAHSDTVSFTQNAEKSVIESTGLNLRRNGILLECSGVFFFIAGIVLIRKITRPKDKSFGRAV